MWVTIGVKSGKGADWPTNEISRHGETTLVTLWFHMYVLERTKVWNLCLQNVFGTCKEVGTTWWRLFEPVCSWSEIGGFSQSVFEEVHVGVWGVHKNNKYSWDSLL